MGQRKMTSQGIMKSHRSVMQAMCWSLQLDKRMGATSIQLRWSTKKYNTLAAIDLQTGILDAQVLFFPPLKGAQGKRLRTRGTDTDAPRRCH